MSKKFSKLALFSALAGVAAAGTYYLLQNRPKRTDDITDDLEDLDDIDEDLENEDFTSDPTAGSTSSRNRSSYVSIDLENAKEKIGENKALFTMSAGILDNDCYSIQNHICNCFRKYLLKICST